MKLTLPFEVLFILHKLQQEGFTAFLVGGSIRDLIIQTATGAKPDQTLITDFDFTTNAKPEEIQAVFPDSFYENEFGTVGVAHENLWEMLEKQNFQLPSQNLATLYQAFLTKKQRPTLVDLSQASKVHESLLIPSQGNQKELVQPKPFEITTYRADGSYDDHRRPSSVVWGKKIEDDLERRDFTINAMALNIKQTVLDNFFAQQVFPPTVELDQSQYKLVDPYGGLKDLARKEISAVGEASLRFKEDALRMLRAIRFSTQLAMTIAPTTLEAINKHALSIEHISWERIQDEFFKILSSPLPKQGIELMDEVGLLEFIMPELLEGKGIEQGGHHNTDVWTHSLDAVDHCPSTDPIVRLATLLHDVGKPRTQKLIDGKFTFYNHEIISSRMASKIAHRFHLSKKDTDRLFILVRYHMFHYQPQNTDASIRRFMRKVGLENIDDILDLREADRLGSGARKTSWRLEEMKQRIVEQLNQPMDVRDLAIDGHDLIEKLGLKPGKKIGEILNQLFEEVLENPELNTPEILLKKAQELNS
ncbi:MAG: HD domain-containing protein [Candidatus Paceibacterota bacterium]